MYCNQCGKKVGEKVKFCPDCGTKLEKDTKKETVASETVYENNSSQNDTKKIYKILSYFGILFIVGILSSDKDDKSVRFHAGQGMILCLTTTVLYIVNALITSFVFTPLFRHEVKIWGFVAGYETSPFGYFIIGLTTFAVSAFMIYMMIRGIMNVMKQEDKELPIIGKFAFYK